jgi:V/A-type H+-transporting ATPase subunit B
MTLKPEKTYQTLTTISGPLLFMEATKDVAYGELVEIELPNGEIRRGQVLEVSENKAIIQVFEGTSGLDIDKTLVKFTGETIKIPVAQEMIGRIFDGSARPIDGGPLIIPEDEIDIHGSPLNPYTREYPREPIQTGISAIDGMNTLVRGQKLPIFTGTGLPHNQLVAQIIRQAKVPGKEEEFLVIFAALGITADEARFFKEESGELA